MDGARIISFFFFWWLLNWTLLVRLMGLLLEVTIDQVMQFCFRSAGNHFYGTQYCVIILSCIDWRENCSLDHGKEKQKGGGGGGGKLIRDRILLALKERQF